MQKRQAGPITQFFMGIIFMAVGGGLTYLKALPDFFMAKESMSWPKTNGTILTSKVEKKTSREKGKTKTSYQANISYRYNLDGKKFVSNLVHVGANLMSSSSSSAYEVKNKYPVGKKVTVYYSKENKHNAILEPGLNSSVFIILGAGVLFTIVGVLIFISSLFKIAIFAAVIAVFTAKFFDKNSGNDPPKGTDPNRSKKEGAKKKASSPSETQNINLDDQMEYLNKVSAASVDSSEEPWNHKWFIKGKEKDYGPYSYEKVITFYESGKIKDVHKCFSSDGEIKYISDIIRNKKAC